MSNRCTASDLKYGIDEKTVLALKNADPTGTRCIYLDWIYRQFVNRQFLLEDVRRVREDLELYHSNKSKLVGKDKDINTLTYSTLKTLLSDMFYTPKILEDTTSIPDTVTLYDGPYGKLYNPKTRQASCKLGSGTKWCTAAKENNMFMDYNNDGPLYIWIDANWNSQLYKDMGGRFLSKKFQFHFESGQYMDELDNRISDELLYYFRKEHPVISQLFSRYEESIKDDGLALLEYMISTNSSEELVPKYVNTRDKEYAFVNGISKWDSDDRPPEQVQEIVERYEEYMEEYDNPKDIVNYVDKWLKGVIGTLDRYIIGHLDREVEYAILQGKPWTMILKTDVGDDLDKKILMDGRYALKYILGTNVRKRRNLGETDDLIVRAVSKCELGLSIPELYSISPEAAVYYAIYVVRCRSKYIEHKGMSGNTSLDSMYRKLFIYGHDIPGNVYEITPKFVDVLYGNEEKYFGPDAECDRQDKDTNTSILMTYKAYIKKYGRSEIIERYLVDYCYKYPDLLLELAVHVFGSKLTYPLGYITPDIEDNVDEVYRYIFDGEELYDSPSIKNLLDYITVNGTNPSTIDLLVNSLNQYSHIVNDNVESMGTIIPYDDLLHIYNSVDDYSAVKFYLYPILFDKRSKKLEAFYAMNKNNYDIKDLYQYYWLKFIKTKNDKYTHGATSKIYMENYPGLIDYQEDMYIQEYNYLKFRVRN